MPKVSVIVPVYRVEDYLIKCLDSIAHQSFSDFDVVLVDDGSPDRSGILCDEYVQRDGRFHVIHQKNAGLSAARNVGIEWTLEHSSSSFLAFIDSDDMIHREYLETLLHQIEETGADIATCEKYDFWNEEELADLAFCQETYHCTGRDACVHLYSMDGVFFIAAWAKIFKKKLFEDIRYPVGKIHEDQAVVPILFYKANSVAKHAAPLYFYRRRNDSIMGAGFSARRFDDIEALEGCRQFFECEQEDEIISLIDVRIITLNSLYTLLSRKAGVYNTIPEKYRMSRTRAVLNLDRHMTYDYFTWYISKIYPWLLKPHAYWRKIKRILKIG